MREGLLLEERLALALLLQIVRSRHDTEVVQRTPDTRGMTTEGGELSAFGSAANFADAGTRLQSVVEIPRA